MKAILHMGNYKTGSTALQHTLFACRRQLLDRRIFYGCTDEAPLHSHARFTYGLLRETLKACSLSVTHRIFPHIPVPPGQLLEEMASGAKEAGCDTLLISNEALFCEAFRTSCGLRFGNLHTPKKPKNPADAVTFFLKQEKEILASFHETLLSLLLKHCERVTAVVYVRAQDAYLESQYSQYCKQPWYEEAIRLPDFAEFVSLRPVTLDYTVPLAVLSAIYGKENMRVFAYPQNESTPAHFFREVLTGDTFSYGETLKNKSLSYDAVEFKRRFLTGEGAANDALTERLLLYDRRHPQKKRFTWFSSAQHEALRAQCAACNEQLNQQWLSNDPSGGLCLAPDLSGRTPYPGLPNETLLDILDNLAPADEANK